MQKMLSVFIGISPAFSALFHSWGGAGGGGELMK